MQESLARLRCSCSRWGEPGIGCRRAPKGALTVPVLLIVAVLSLGSARAQPPQKTEAYFAQGQAMYYPNDRPRSQQEATQDMISSGVLQAVAGVMGPAGTQSMFGAIQEKILSNKNKYVDGYQLASEGLANGLYRVTGQVTVSKELLLQDLREHGFHVPPPPQARVSEVVQDQTTRMALNASQEAEGGRPGRNPGLSRLVAVWAVAENWEEKWIVPEDAAEGGIPPFARSILENTRHLDWTPRFVRAQSLPVDKQGNMKLEDVLAASRLTGLDKAVMGKSWLDASQPANRRLLALLQIVDVATGSIEGEIQEERALDGASVEEGILHLAESVLPSIDRVLTPDKPRDREGGSDTGQHLEIWTLIIRANHPQSAWESVRKEVESLFRSAKTSGFEMGVAQITVQIEGVDGRSVRDALNGREISPGGSTVRIEDFSEEQRSMAVVFGNSGETQ